MNTIQYKYVLLAFACLILFCFCLGAALFSPLLLIPGVFGLVGFYLVDKKYLRCPYCGRHNALDKLFIAKRRKFYCVHCWEQIIVE